MQSVNIGLIGCGSIATLVYLNLLHRLPGVSLSAIAEPDEAQREKARRAAPQTRLYSDYKSLLRDPGINAVIICLPNQLHAEAAVWAFESGTIGEITSVRTVFSYRRREFPECRKRRITGGGACAIPGQSSRRSNPSSSEGATIRPTDFSRSPALP